MFFLFEGFYVSGAETPVHGAETTVHAPRTYVHRAETENLPRGKEKPAAL